VLVPSAGFGFVMMVNTDTTAALSAAANEAVLLFAPPPGPIAPLVKTDPAAWQAYVGTYADPYGGLGELRLELQDASLQADYLDGGLAAVGTQVSGDDWVFSAPDGGGRPLQAVFWRDDAGSVREVVTRAGVAYPVPEDAGRSP
jgi:hypothetical protein